MEQRENYGAKQVVRVSIEKSDPGIRVVLYYLSGHFEVKELGPIEVVIGGFSLKDFGK